MLSSLIVRFFPTHAWDAGSTEEQRTCQVCGRVEHYQDTDGWVAPTWRAVYAGDKKAHVAAAKSTSVKGQSAAIREPYEETHLDVLSSAQDC